MKTGLRYAFLGMLGAIFGIIFLARHFVFTPKVDQSLGLSLPPAPALISTGTPGRVLAASKNFNEDKMPAQAILNGKKRWDFIFYDKSLPSVLEGCNLTVYGANKYNLKNGAFLATWYPISIVESPQGDGGCFSPPPGPVIYSTGAEEGIWTGADKNILAAPPPLGVDVVRKVLGEPELVEIKGKYSHYAGRDAKIKGISSNMWQFTLIRQTDIYRFKNRVGYLKISYDGMGMSTKIENGTVIK